MNHLNQEPLDFAAAVALLHKARKELQESLDDTERLILEQAETLALLRELNDALVIPGWLQPRVDALLDSHEELLPQTHPAPSSALAAICELDGCCMLRDKIGPQQELK